MVKTKKIPDKETLRKLVRYEPETGKLYWKKRGTINFDSRFAGKKAFDVDKGNGYLHGRLGGKNYAAHRIVWAVVHGTPVPDTIDHIDNNGFNNRIENLRAVETWQNCSRYSKKKRNFYRGVSWGKRDKKWIASLSHKYKRISCGRSNCPTIAAILYDAKAEELKKEFAVLNFPNTHHRQQLMKALGVA